MLFLVWADKSRYRRLFENRRKEGFVGRNEYPETINRAYKLLVHTSRPFGGSIIKGGRQFFINERGHGDRTSVMFIETRGDQGEPKHTSGSNSSQGYPIPVKYK